MKMNCSNVRLELPGYRNLKKEDPIRSAVDVHLGTCAVCRSESQRMIALWGTLGLELNIKPSVDFRPRFWEKIRRADEMESPVWGWLTWRRWTAVTAGALAAWMIGISGPAFWAVKNLEARSVHPAVAIISSPFAEESIADIYFKGPTHE